MKIINMLVLGALSAGCNGAYSEDVLFEELQAQRGLVKTMQVENGALAIEVSKLSHELDETTERAAFYKDVVLECNAYTQLSLDLIVEATGAGTRLAQAGSDRGARVDELLAVVRKAQVHMAKGATLCIHKLEEGKEGVE